MKLLRRVWPALAVVALAAAMFAVGAAQAQTPAPPTAPTAVDAKLLIQSDGTFYLYHDGVKFELPLADMSDVQVRAIPSATEAQWDEHFSTPVTPLVPAAPQPFPGYS
jgi:hypothetical protein